jgi:hypothetical protein
MKLAGGKFSEEEHPRVCPPGHVVVGISALDDNSDNHELYCQELRLGIGATAGGTRYNKLIRNVHNAQYINSAHSNALLQTSCTLTSCKWTHLPSGQIKNLQGSCLENAEGSEGKNVWYTSCDSKGALKQTWTVDSQGRIVSAAGKRLCLSASTDSDNLVMAACSTSNMQRWTWVS